MRPHVVHKLRLLLSVGAALLGTALFGTALHAQSDEPPPPLRRVLVVDGDTVRLGEPLGELVRFIGYPGDTMVRFPPGSFEGSDGAMAVFDASGKVRRLGFLYGERHNMDVMIGRLYNYHGRSPKHATFPIPEGTRETWTWSDKETELTFTRFTPAQSSVVGLLLVTNLKR